MDDPAGRSTRRAGALIALAGLLAAGGLVLTFLIGAPGRLVGALVAAGIVIMAGWFAVTRTGPARVVGFIVAAVALVLMGLMLVRSWTDVIGLILIVVCAAVSIVAARYALGLDTATLKARPIQGRRVEAATHGVLVMNPRSGGGKVGRWALADEAARHGVEPVVLQPGDDLRELVLDAARRGADVIGVAGGDGSQAVVASVAIERGLPMVVVPAGTLNHFARDLGLDREDVVGALDAFDAAVERSVDVGRVGDRVFVNNVSLGVYGRVVQSDEYRDDKIGTIAAVLPAVFGPEAEPFGFRFDGPDGSPGIPAQLILVSNNPYELVGLSVTASRRALDGGVLGIITAAIESPAKLAELVALDTVGKAGQFEGVVHWAAERFNVDSVSPIELGIDGEALMMDPPVEFRSLPSALRIRLPRSAPGLSPAAARVPSGTELVKELVRVAFGTGTPSLRS